MPIWHTRSTVTGDWIKKSNESSKTAETDLDDNFEKEQTFKGNNNEGSVFNHLDITSEYENFIKNNLQQAKADTTVSSVQQSNELLVASNSNCNVMVNVNGNPKLFADITEADKNSMTSDEYIAYYQVYIQQ